MQVTRRIKAREFDLVLFGPPQIKADRRIPPPSSQAPAPRFSRGSNRNLSWNTSEQRQVFSLSLLSLFAREAFSGQETRTLVYDVCTKN